MLFLLPFQNRMKRVKLKMKTSSRAVKVRNITRNKFNLCAGGVE